MKAGETIIELFSFPNPPERVSFPEACGLRHIAFTAKDFNKTINSLKTKDIELEDVRINPYTGYW